MAVNRIVESTQNKQYCFDTDETITVLSDTSIQKLQWPIRQYYISLLILFITTAKYIIYNPRNKDTHFIPEICTQKAIFKPIFMPWLQDAPSLVALQQTAPSLRTALQAGLLEANLDMSMLAEKWTDDTNM